MKKHTSSIISKPKITKPNFYSDKSEPAIITVSGGHRVDGGWVSKYGTFIPDTKVADGYYTLSLRNRNIRDLDEIFRWFSDDELNKIEELDISYNEITSIDQAFVKLKSLTILRASNNKITSINTPRKKHTYFEKIDLSCNKLTSLNSFEGFEIGHLDLAYNSISEINTPPLDIHYLNLSYNNIQFLSHLDSLFETRLIRWDNIELNLVGNPIDDVESLKSLSLTIHSMEEYEVNNKDVEYNDFKSIRDYIDLEIKQAAQTVLERLFKRINEKKLFIYLDKEIIDSTGLPQNNGNDDFDGLNYIEIEVKDKIDWITFCDYFGLKVKGDSKFGCAGVLTILIVVTLFFFIL